MTVAPLLPRLTKPEPWWPLRWYRSGFHGSTHAAPVRDHPTVGCVYRGKAFGVFQSLVSLGKYAYFLKRIDLAGAPGVDDMVIRCVLLELAYPTKRIPPE